MNIKKGDTVQILKGKDKGKSGKVIKIDREKNKVTVDGLNLFKKHVKPKRQGEKGEVVEVSRFIPASNVLLWCSACGRGVRIGVKRGEEGKARHCKKCGGKI